MQKNFEDIEVLYPENFQGNFISESRPIEPFSEMTVDFLNDIAKWLSKHNEVRKFPDVATFAFYCRKANILAKKREHERGNDIRLGRGIVFHISPSNVPVNFAYSLISGMLAGNANIVRVPSESFRQVEMITDAIEYTCSKRKHKEIASRLVLIRYDRHSSATKYFSSFCDVRIIWGGDETIAQIRKNPLPPRSYDITFADRYSLCAINADRYINESYPERIAQGFYNDTFLFDQNACTSPHLIIWLGDKINVHKSKEIFWNNLYKIATTKYSIKPIIAVDKLTTLYEQAIELSQVRKQECNDNLIWRIELKNLDHNIDQNRCAGGYFSEYHASSLSELIPIITRKYQTLSYYGIPKKDLQKFILNEKPNGIDRIVPIGNTMDFSLVWDGYNLINVLSREVESI